MLVHTFLPLRFEKTVKIAQASGAIAGPLFSKSPGITKALHRKLWIIVPKGRFQDA